MNRLEVSNVLSAVGHWAFQTGKETLSHELRTCWGEQTVLTEGRSMATRSKNKYKLGEAEKLV